jgi:hypothetical protein
LTKVDLVDLINRLADELREARAGGPAGGSVMVELERWLGEFELVGPSAPLAAVARNLAARMDSGALDDKAVAAVARELRSAVADIRELVGDGDSGEAEPDELQTELRRLTAV